MRYSDWLWLAPLTAAFAAGSARAQLLATVKPPVASVVQTVKPNVHTLLAAPKPVLSPVTGAVRNTFGQLTNTLGGVTTNLVGVTTLSSPLLKAPLGTSASTLTGTQRPSLSSQLNRGAFASASPLALPTQTALAGARIRRLQALISANPSSLDTDDLGRPVVRGEILVLDAPQATIARLQRAGFRIVTDVTDAQLGFRRTTLASPRAQPTRAALRELRALAPSLQADYDHVYEPAGGPLQPGGRLIHASHSPAEKLVGMIDGGVAAHPALVGRIVAQQGFAGAAAPTGHGTSVASLLVGQQGRFFGAAHGASLLVADVYGSGREAGSASAIADALSWLAARRPQVINVSLVGPPNLVVQRAIAAVQRRGIPVVAAVGNDGPASPPQYPASYPGVISITGVDARGVALFESGNATHVDFAAPGADMVAARPGGGYTRVRGTSFASPLVAGRLAMLGSLGRLAAEARPGKGRVGRGIVCMTCRIDPRLLGAD